MSEPKEKDSPKMVKELSEEQKKKALEKAQRRAQFEAQNLITKTNTKATKAERRALQESQRLKKTVINKDNIVIDSKIDNKKKVDLKTQKLDKTNENKTNDNKTNDNKTKQQNNFNEISINKDINESETKPSKETKTKIISKPSPTSLVKKGQIFSHIPQRTRDISLLSDELNNSLIHPIVIEIGFRINKNLIRGSNAECVAMLLAFKRVIEDYITPPSKELARHLESIIDSYVKFLAKCRPISISMSNAVKYLKLTFSRIPAETDDINAKKQLCESIDNFIDDEIICAQRGIAELAITKVKDESDVILTFGCSLIVKHVLYNAAKKGKKFRVVVVDSRPRFDGREMLQYLLQHNIPATYIFINAVSYVMKEVTKVLLGAHSLLANGYVMSHIGSSQIALVAHAYNVPVLVCCETYKFSERVHTDSFVHNELGDSTDFFNSLKTSGKSQIETNNDLNVLDLLYDVTPHEFVSVVITEKGVLPCTSAPAVLRVRETK